MRCDEVIELMQRHVDRDLDAGETLRMKTHASTCADCSDMLSRLERLNEDLENLPKVTPAFSIVDSILPKLQEIDAAGSAGNIQAAAVESEPAEGNATPLRRKSYARWPSSWKAAGVVAAGLLLGLMIFNGLPKSFPKGASESASDSAATANTMSADVAVADTAAAEEGVKNQSRMIAEQPDVQESEAAQPQENSVSDAQTSPQSDPQSIMQDQGVSSGTVAEPLTPPADNAEQEKAAPAGGGGDSQQAPGIQSIAPESGAEGPAEPAPDEGMIFGIAAIPADDAPSGEVTDGAAPNRGFAAAPQDGSKGKAEAAPQNAGLASDDGSLLAVVETGADGTKQVKITDREGVKAIASGRQWSSDATLVLEGWSEHALRYSVSTANGSFTYTLDADSGTEAETGGPEKAQN